jgi:CTP synthase (UTP-ammonia lyase)
MSLRTGEFQTHVRLIFSQERLFDRVSIALVGKYTDLKDSYMSVIKALEHSAFRCQRKLTLQVRLPFSLKSYELVGNGSSRSG